VRRAQIWLKSAHPERVQTARTAATVH